mmetsp:Transcript_17362/g.42474  ORF Transcript_17362/g.42474 Transcript_17362/m.42474 type:complete len:86 (+) Transcript_17362:469-726(+)
MAPRMSPKSFQSLEMKWHSGLPQQQRLNLSLVEKGIFMNPALGSLRTDWGRVVFSGVTKRLMFFGSLKILYERAIVGSHQTGIYE